jgi:hypothetical protein
MLNKAKTLNDYKLQSLDGEIGSISEFLFDDQHWAIRYLVIDTRNWLPGKKILVSPQWIERVSWNESKVFFDHPREAIKQSPEYSEESLITRDYETGLHQHYNRKEYWIDEPASREH